MTNAANTATAPIHASNRRGQANCGDTTPGRGQANVDFYPERWTQVTCPACKASRDA
jgi:hypothetical protein